VPLADLPRVRDVGFDWRVPAMREELVTALIRSLPKDLRRPLVPVPDVAREVTAGLRPRKGALVDAMAREIAALRGVHAAREDFNVAGLPPHLRFTFQVEDEHGAVLARGDDLAAVREQVKPRLREELTAAAAGVERSGLREWPGTIPRVVEMPGLSGYPALVDEGEAVGVQVLETPDAQRRAMWAGTLRLLALTVPRPNVTAALTNAQKLTLAGHGDITDDVIAAAIAYLVDEPAWDDAGWQRLRGHVAGNLHDTAVRAMRLAVEVLDAAAEARRAMGGPPAEQLRGARLDVAAQIGRLTHPGFVAAAGIDRLPDVARYLRAAAYRLQRLPDNVATDRERMATIHELEAQAKGNRAAQWAIEELRVAYFAQALGVRGPASAKKVRALLG
jgi:ATP-dependent helicase HrpA